MSAAPGSLVRPRNARGRRRRSNTAPAPPSRSTMTASKSRSDHRSRASRSIINPIYPNPQNCDHDSRIDSQPRLSTASHGRALVDRLSNTRRALPTPTDPHLRPGDDRRTARTDGTLLLGQHKQSLARGRAADDSSRPEAGTRDVASAQALSSRSHKRTGECLAASRSWGAPPSSPNPGLALTGNCRADA
jgi:hypothetical protein